MVVCMIKKLITIYGISLSPVVYAIELDPIVIESSKLDETLIDIPTTVDIVDIDKLSISKIHSLQNLSSVLPNTNISGIGNRSDTTVSMRGIANYVTTESSVAMYIDDVPVPFSYGFGAMDITSVDRIEVFKGAQGTDFGKNAESGVINVYTKPISDSLQSEASIDYSSYGSKIFYGRISGPSTIDKLGFSCSITDSRSDGYITNELTHTMLDYRHLTNVNTKLKYEPTFHLNILLNYTKTKVDDGGTAFKIDTKGNPYSIDNEPKNDSVKMDTDLVSLMVKYIQNNTSLTSVSNYGRQSIQKNDYIAKLGVLNIAMDDFVDINIEEISQELRLNGIYKEFDYVLGGFYSDKLRFNYSEKQTFPSLQSLNNTNNLDNLDMNLALFGKMRYALNSNFSFTSGLRYQQTKRDFTRDYTGYPSALSSTIVSEQWLPTFSLSYDKNQENVYLTYSKGYRAGGYNYRSPGTILIPYKPEITESLELGYKNGAYASWSMENAFFYNRMRDVRTITFNDYLATTTLNADKAHSYGFESTLRYVSDALDMYGSIGVTQSKYDHFISNSIDYTGKNLIDVPNLTVAMGGKYKLDMNWYSTVSLTYMGKRFYDVANTTQENGYAIVNASLGYDKKTWTAEIYTNNMFDSMYSDFMIHTPSHNYYHFGAPRIIGFKMNCKI